MNARRLSPSGFQSSAFGKERNVFPREGACVSLVMMADGLEFYLQLPVPLASVQMLFI